MQHEEEDADPVQCCAAGLVSLVPTHQRRNIGAMNMSNDRVRLGMDHHERVDKGVHAHPCFINWEKQAKTLFNSILSTEERKNYFGKHSSLWIPHCLVEHIIGAGVLACDEWKTMYRTILRGRAEFFALLHDPNALRTGIKDASALYDRVAETIEKQFDHYHDLPDYARISLQRLIERRRNGDYEGEPPWADAINRMISSLQEDIAAEAAQTLMRDLSQRVTSSLQPTKPDSAILDITA